ncbi:Ig-like domain-containing protein [Sulfitobacter sp. G21635-S1]|uniref:Ig-like domain-containing protein n=1 Tax=Sulfitobacter sp. G21635-S1 TaxID=3014043 RepID=UPI0022B00F38|nr:Ig-like domain-containing protein [Sulfitobacter sp. G21635-S1]MCZ4254668.1 Ig-like domain-containing protein [Sulfitobacter sp. G21635-S1]
MSLSNTAPVAENDAVATDADNILSGSVLADNGSGADNDPDAGTVLGVIEVNGVAANIGQQITLPSGALLTLNADGTFDYDPNGAFDALPDGESVTDTFTYTLTDGELVSAPGIFAAELELSELDGGDGFVINGIDPVIIDPGVPDGENNIINQGDHSGNSVAAAGDVNGDGIDDLLIGAWGADGNGFRDAGETYVIFGNASGFDASLELSELDGSNGFVINGVGNLDLSGISVSSAGDVNGDGIGDLIIGASGANPNQYVTGAAYVVFGNTAGFDANFDLDALNGSNGFAIHGMSFHDYFGESVSSAGDVNGDGIDDVIIGAVTVDANAENSGASYIVFGSDAGFAPNLELSSLDGSNGFAISGLIESDRFGRSVSSAGDLNGDGIDDVIIGADGADPNGIQTGATYVIFGSNEGFDANFDLNALDGRNGFVINGLYNFDNSGYSVSYAGDVNGDGIADVIIGAPNANRTDVRSGQSYVVFGNAEGFDPSLELSALNGSNGFLINGVARGDRSGTSVSSAGDVNGDGIDDLIIGAPRRNFSSSGESYIVFGTSTGFERQLDLSALDGTNGFVVNGINEFDLSGISVSAAGDVNGDGIDDLIIGAPGADPNGNASAGQTYVIYGRISFVPVIDVGTVTVTINGVDDAAISRDDAFDVGENAALSGLSVFGDNGFGADTDIDSPLLITAVNGSAADVGQTVVLASGALLVLNADGTFDYDPNGQFEHLPGGVTATDSFTYELNGDATATVTITINGANDATVAQDDALTSDGLRVLQGSVFADNGSGFDNDPDSNSQLTVVEVNGVRASVGQQIMLPSGALLTLNADGTFDYVPFGAYEVLGAGLQGSDSFTYRVSDGLGWGGDVATVTITLGALDGNIAQFGTSDSELMNGDPDSDILFGLRGNDTILGNQGNDTLSGGEGADLVFGNAGFDTLWGDEGDDTLDGGANTDQLNGGSGDDRLVGGQGYDNLYGDAGNDTLLGGTDADRLYGGADDDLLYGGTNVGLSVDRLFGEEGNDTLYGEGGFDHLDGGAGNDLLDGGNQADNLYGRSGNDTLIGGQGFDRLFGGDNDDLLHGDAGTDGLFGEQGDDTLDGGTGNDRLWGGTGNDDLSGGADNDLVQGGAGFDRIDGGTGDDTLIGNFNADTFVFTDGHGNDTITDFDATNDLETIDFSNLSTINTLADLLGVGGAASQSGANVLIDTGDGNTITLLGVNLNELHANDFIF